MRKREAGFTLMEIMVATAIFAILCAIAVPNYIGWLPGHRLRSAAADIRSNLQLAKMRAIKENRYYAVVFDPQNGDYKIFDCGPNGTYESGNGVSANGDDVKIKTVSLNEYGSGVSYGHTPATKNVPGNAFPGSFDNVSYTVPAVGNVAMFAPTGLAQTSAGAFSSGYVYIANSRSQTCAVGTNSVAGNIVSRTWTDGDWR